MRRERRVAIHDLEHQEIGDLCRPAAPRRDGTRGERLGALVQ